MNYRVAESADLGLLADILKREELCYDDLATFNGEVVEVFNDLNELIGFYGLENCDEDVILRSVVILDQFRKQGHGYQVIDHAIRNARNKKLETMYLLTTTAADFFAKIGFEVMDRKDVPVAVSTTNEFQNFCPDTAVCMRRRLS